MRKPLLVIGGPTAAGKTRMAVAAAKALNGEVVSADSMQVFKYMDIGTAKPTFGEREGVPHHMLDVITPDVPYSVADYAAEAKKRIADIHKRGRLPILAGGSGFYINAVLFDTDFEQEASDHACREELAALAKEKGNEYLHSRLSEVDKESAAAIHPNNIKRVIRALEYFVTNNEPISKHNKREREKASPYNYVFFAAAAERAELYERINQRADRMLADGLAEEVRALYEMGYTKACAPLSGLGYKEIGLYLEGRLSYEAAVSALKQNTRRYAKRQVTWFKNKTDARFITPREFYLPGFLKCVIFDN